MSPGKMLHIINNQVFICLWCALLPLDATHEAHWAFKPRVVSTGQSRQLSFYMEPRKLEYKMQQWMSQNLVVAIL